MAHTTLHDARGQETDRRTHTRGDAPIYPFVAANANASQLDAIFWIEVVMNPVIVKFLRLQDVQRVILDFLGIDWPHISVSTLRKP